MSNVPLGDIPGQYGDSATAAGYAQRYRFLVENSSDAVWTMKTDGTVTYVSPSVERLLGITPEELTSVLQLQYPPASAAIVMDYFARVTAAIAEGARPPDYHGELEYYRKDGSILSCELHVVPYVSDDGRPIEILGVLHDIGESKRLAAAEARFRRLMETSNVGMALNTPDGRFDVVNQALCDLLGYDEETLKTKTWQELTPAHYLDTDLRNIEDLAAGRLDTYRVTKQFIHADGHLVWADLLASCLRDPDGQLERFVAQIVDVTEEVQARQELAERERQVRALADRLQAELSSAAEYVRSILPGDLHGTVEISSRYLPSLEVGGDGFHYRWLDEDHLKVYLIDVSGHGIKPALLSVSVHNLIRSDSLPKSLLLSPDRLLTKLNRLFRMDEQAGIYFTIWYGVYQPSTRTLRYASAGHPPALALHRDHDTVAVTRLATTDQPIGMFDDSSYSCESFTVPTGGQILLYSDGAFDLPGRTGDGKGLSHNEFVELCATVARRPDWSLDDLLDRLTRSSHHGQFDDDCALVLLSFP